MQNDTHWSKITRWLHSLIAVTFITQLALSLVLAPPDEFDEASGIAIAAMEGHEIVGLIAAGLLFIHWLWLFIPSSDVRLKNLFPYYPAGIKRVKDEIAYLIKNKRLPTSDSHGGLAGCIHGLGILIASGIAFSGVGLYIVMDFTAGGFENPLFENIAELHEAFGSLMWTYLVLHVFAAAWHEYAGEKIVARMAP